MTTLVAFVSATDGCGARDLVALMYLAAIGDAVRASDTASVVLTVEALRVAGYFARPTPPSVAIGRAGITVGVAAQPEREPTVVLEPAL